MLGAAIAAVALAASACSSSGTTSSSTSSSTTPTGTSSSTSTAASGNLAAIQAKVTAMMGPITGGVTINEPAITNLPSLKGKTLLLIPVLGIVFGAAEAQVEQALKHVGLSVKVCDGQGNPSTIANCMAQAGSIPNLAGVMTLGLPYQQVPASFKALAAKHIPVLAAQANPDGQPSSKYLAFVGTTKLFTVAGEAADDYIIAKSDGKANVLSLGLSDSLDTRTESTAMANYLKANCPGCTVSEKNLQSQNLDQGTNVVSAAVLQNSKLEWLNSINLDASGTATAKGLKSANATTKVSQGGIGNGISALGQVASGTARFTALLSGNLLSWDWCDAFLRLIAGNAVPTDYPVAVRLIDQTNVHTLKVNNAESTTFDWFGGNASFQTEYAKLWGAS